MASSTVLLSGHIIIGGVKFLWWVTEGRPVRITVSHPVYGTQTAPVEPNAEQQAKTLARAMLAATQSPSVKPAVAGKHR